MDRWLVAVLNEFDRSPRLDF